MNKVILKNISNENVILIDAIVKPQEEVRLDLIYALAVLTVYNDKLKLIKIDNKENV